MSQENVEMMRRMWDFLNRGEFDQALDFAHDDFEMNWSNSIGPYNGIYRGRRKVKEVWGSFVEAWEDVRWEPNEIINLDASHVIAVTRIRMRGRGSGIEVEATGAQLWTIRAGRFQQSKLYQSKADALEAAGLAE